MSGDLLRLCGLWMRTSRAGKEYLVGRLGNARVLIMDNRERATDDDPSHWLLIGERNLTTDTTTTNPRED